MVSEQDKQGLTYADAGVDINAGNRAVDLIKKHIGRTHRSEVLSSLGGFSGFFALDLKRYQQPVLVSGTDGVGTKLKVAMLMDKHDTIGIDCVAMCANDILVNGAEPLFFLDYLAVGKLVPEKVEAIVKGVVEGCAQAGCALIGGETAEMPGLYDEDEYDLAGFVVGAVDKAKIIDGSQIVPGDVIVGITSSGLHSNGFSLARKVLLEKAGYGVDVYLPELGKTLGEELLTPTRIYAQTVKNLLSQVLVKGMVHITGGGLTENVPRVLPKGTKAVIDLSSWPVSPIFDLIYRLGNVPNEEMLRTFNLGIGYVFIVDKNDLNKLRNVLNGLGEKSYELGTIIKSEDTPSVQTLNQHFARG